MQATGVRRTAYVVAVLTAVGAIAASAGASPGTPGGPTQTGGPAIGASNDVSGASGPTSGLGTSGSSGTTGATGTSGSSGATGATGTSGSGGTGAQQPPVAQTPSTPQANTPSTQTPTGPTGVSGPTATNVGESGAFGANHHRHHRHHSLHPVRHHHPSTSGGSSGGPAIVGGSAQPRSGRHARGLGRHVGRRRKGPTAPPPSIFSGANPLAGVLPGSWSDPFIVPGGVDVPQFYVESFHVPPFLLPIYQAAGAAYDVPWQTLAAINEVETNYGTNLDVSSAGAIGWMQFLPSTWRRYGVDASGSGTRDPYNAADAIFSAARYLSAAGAAHNLPRAIFAYNHSWGYVRSVLDRAELLSGEPSALVASVSELAEGDFPIQLGYRATYRRAAAPGGSARAGGAGGSGSATAPAPNLVGAFAASPTRHSAPAADIFASSHAAVVAAQDGTVVAIGRNRRLGRYIVLRNAFGDRFTYANLGSVTAWYPTPRLPRRSARILSASVPGPLAPGPRPTRAPASAGSQPHGHRPPSRLFGSSSSAGPARHAAAAGTPIPVVAALNLRSRPSATRVFVPLALFTAAVRTSHRSHLVHRARHARPPALARYFTAAFALRASELRLVRLHVGSHVMAGTILGHLARTARGRTPHLLFELRPAGSAQSAIDPRPFLDAWSQLETLELHRNPFAAAPVYGPNLHPRTVGEVLDASQLDLERVVLQDTRITMPACERSAIAGGNVDRRVLASLEVLVLHGIDPTVSGAWCSRHARTRHSTPALLKTPNAIALIALDGRPATAAAASVAGHALSSLPRAARPALSERTVAGKLVIAFAPAHAPAVIAAAASFTSGFALSATRWSELDTRLAQIAEPRVPNAVSPAALPVLRAARRHRHTAVLRSRRRRSS